MCGIVGLYLKNHELEGQLGALFEPMLISMTDRGSDSAGFAIYHDVVSQGWVKLTLYHPSESIDWSALSQHMATDLDCAVKCYQHAKVAILKINAPEYLARHWLSESHPELLILSAGESIEILKDVGSPASITQKFNLGAMQGSHIIGHTRMATESAITIEGSHPFSTGSDLCLVHNGSLSNHNRLREHLRRVGIQIETENDSEVAAGYLTWRLMQGDSLKSALEKALKDLDGFFTFAIGTKDGFAVMRDAIACKPAVMAETNDYVAMASEYQALTRLPDIESAKVWEPEPARFYLWERS